MRTQQGSIVYDLEKHEMRVAVKALVPSTYFSPFERIYQKRTASKDKFIPETVFDVLTLNDYVGHEAQIGLGSP